MANVLRRDVRRYVPGVLVALLVAGQVEAAGPDEASLRYYPTVEQVRKDVEAERRDDRPGEVEGRISGQYLLLAEVLESSWGGRHGPTSFDAQAPGKAKRLRDLYLDASAESGTHRFPALQPECSGRTVEEQKAKGICARVNYMAAQSSQRFQPEEVLRVAQRYFPSQYRDAFIRHSPAQELDEYASRIAQERQAGQRKADLESKYARHEVMRRRVLAGAILAMLAVPMVALALLMRRAKRQQARATSLTRITSSDDLYLFSRSGRAVDVQRHSRKHVTTTTETPYVHPDSWQSRAPSTTTTITTTDHLTLFIKGDDGDEWQESFVDLRVAVRAGDRVTLVYGGDRWSRTGVAVAIVNMDTREVAVDVLQARRIASRYSLLRAAFWGLRVAAVGATADMAFGMFAFTLAGLALGLVAALTLAFAWQRSLWANIQARIRVFANGLAAEV
ncbi:MAG: hypothetical protein HZT39_05270 [Pseudoxanthomonas sp.]|nr:MAG: hypothetical protein HZT39_05270 [Pseudoxanthomonas sp.]